MIDQPTLDVRRTSDGRVFVAGLRSLAVTTDESMLAMVRPAELVIRHGAIRWTDELRGVPLVRQGGGPGDAQPRARHDLRLDATPPPAGLGTALRAGGQFRQPFLSMRNGRWRDRMGQAGLPQLSHVEVRELKRHADIGADLQQGRGALQAWVDVGGEVSAVTADLARWLTVDVTLSI